MAGAAAAGFAAAALGAGRLVAAAFAPEAGFVGLEAAGVEAFFPAPDALSLDFDSLPLDCDWFWPPPPSFSSIPLAASAMAPPFSPPPEAGCSPPPPCWPPPSPDSPIN